MDCPENERAVADVEADAVILFGFGVARRPHFCLRRRGGENGKLPQDQRGRDGFDVVGDRQFVARLLQLSAGGETGKRRNGGEQRVGIQCV